MVFPLYLNDGQPWRNLYPNQVDELKDIYQKIDGGKYKFIENFCLCGNRGGCEDILISEKDRYGIGINYVLCKKCALIRAKKVFDDESLRLFYKDNYRKLYKGIQVPSVDFVKKDQYPRGDRLAELIERVVEKNEIRNVFEFGCSAGGILEKFQERSWFVSGCDWDLNFLNFGRERGLDLYYGDINSDKTPIGSQDLIIMSHVMEHLVDPESVIRNISRYLRDGGYLLVEVPGTFTIENPLQFFHISHIFNFYEDFLRVFFSEIGFDIVYGDEFCTFVLKKNKPVEAGCLNEKMDFSLLGDRYIKVAAHLLSAYKKFDG